MCGPAIVEKLTPARAFIAELVRRCSVLGLGCRKPEVHKLAWLPQRSIVAGRLTFVPVSADQFANVETAVRRWLGL